MFGVFTRRGLGALREAQKKVDLRTAVRVSENSGLWLLYDYGMKEFCLSLREIVKNLIS